MYNKDFFASKTTWGALIMLLAPALKTVGIEIDEQGVVDAITTLVGLGVFLWGQFTRKSEINTVAGIKVK